MALDEKQLSDQGKAILDASRDSLVVSWVKGIAGAAMGGAAGWFVFSWLLGQGLYGLAIPAAFVGVGFSLLSKRSILAGGFFCMIAGFILMIVCEWYFFAFNKDPSFSYFVTHLHQMDKSMTYVFFVLGSLFAFWFGKGR
jgi:hypothetical protein